MTNCILLPLPIYHPPSPSQTHFTQSVTALSLLPRSILLVLGGALIRQFILGPDILAGRLLVTAFLEPIGNVIIDRSIGIRALRIYQWTRAVKIQGTEMILL